MPFTDPDFEQRVRASFGQQRVMQTLNVEIARLEAGEIELTMPFNPAFTQQHGFLHAGIITTALDSACSWHPGVLADAKEAAVLTVEFKTNLLAPARGQYFVFAEGW